MRLAVVHRMWKYTSKGGHTELEVVVVLFIVATLKGINLLTSLEKRTRPLRYYQRLLTSHTKTVLMRMFAERASQGLEDMTIKTLTIAEVVSQGLLVQQIHVWFFRAK